MAASTKNETNSKPKVVISLPPILQSFCRFMFQTSGQNIIISRSTFLGKLIYSTILTSDIPIKRPFEPNETTFILPVTSEGHYILKYRFIYLPGWAQEKLVDNIEYEFKKWVREMFELGYQKKFTQKEIIEAILMCLNVRDNKVNYDTIKKIDYRHRRSNTRKRFLELLEASKIAS